MNCQFLQSRSTFEKREDLKHLKAGLPIPKVWEHIGLPGKPGHYCHSPFREDTEPSFSIFENGQRWKDFGTGEGGDVIDFIAHAGELDLSEATRYFLKLAGNAAPVPLRLPKAAHATTGGDPQRLRKNLEDAEIHMGSSEEVASLARLRRIDPAAIHLAQRLSTLAFGRVCGFSCWILTDGAGRVAEARKIDGKPFPAFGQLPQRKAHTLGGSSKSWPAGVAVLRKTPTYRVVLIVEGGPDYLAALHFVLEMGAGDVLPVAMLGRSTGTSIHTEALALLRGKRVRVCPHVDSDGGGMKAAKVWAKQVHSEGCHVDYFTLEELTRRDGKAVTDLNDAILVSPCQKTQLSRLLP